MFVMIKTKIITKYIFITKFVKKDGFNLILKIKKKLFYTFEKNSG